MRTPVAVQSWTGLVALISVLLVALVAQAKDEPTYMRKLFDDLASRRKLFEETPPEEVKYWFEYAGPLQVRGRLAFVLC